MFRELIQTEATGANVRTAAALLQNVCHALAVEAGWHTDPKTGEHIERNKGESIALMHSELSEALEGFRKGTMDSHLPHRAAAEVELADLIIRVFDSAGAWEMDLAGALLEKLRYNVHRSDHKLANRVKEGGKAF